MSRWARIAKRLGALLTVRLAIAASGVPIIARLGDSGGWWHLTPEFVSDLQEAALWVVALVLGTKAGERQGRESEQLRQFAKRDLEVLADAKRGQARPIRAGRE